VLRVAAVAEQDDVILSWSDPLQHELVWDCPVDGVHLSAPRTTLSVNQVTLRKMVSSDCGSPRNNATGQSLTNFCKEEADVLTISDIVVESTDGNVDSVIVLAAVDHGLLTITNQSAWDPRSLQGRPWVNRLVLEAHPKAVTAALSSLVYQSYRPGPDSLTIQVLYGSCNRTDLNYSGPDCQVASRVMEIVVIPSVRGDPVDSRLFHASFGPMLFCLFVYPLLYLVWIRLECWWVERSASNPRTGRGSES
jgi:hypothetical protein